MQQQELTIKNWFNTILDHAPDAIMALKAVRDRQGNIIDLEFLFTNKKALSSVGRTELTGKYFTKEFPGTVKSGLFDLYSNVIETGNSWGGKIHYDADGINTWAYVSAAKMEDGCIISYIDIAERKKVEEKIYGQSFLLQQITSLVPDIITVLELPSLRMIYSNEENLALHGFDREEMLKMSREERMQLVHPDDIPLLRDLFSSFTVQTCNEEIKTAEYRARHKSGEWLWFFVRSKIFERNADGTVRTIVNVIQNITQRKETEVKIQQLNKTLMIKNRALESANSEIKMFSGIAANDYSETLRHLYTNLEHIVSQDAGKLSDSGRANLRRAQSAIQKMRLLTDDLMAYTKLQEMDEESKEVDLNAILQSVLGEFASQLKQFELQVACDAMPVTGHPFLLSLVFHHLVDNAIKFRKENNRHKIGINCRQSVSGNEISIEAVVKNMRYHIVTITDNGIGFPQEESEKIFEIFFRLNEKSKYKGSGIGLAICKKIMDLHGGFIEAESRPLEGASFHCFFPV